MGKLLFWVAVVAVAYFAFKLIAISQRKSERAAERDTKRGTGSDGRGGRGGKGEPMRQCAHCGVHLPASDALTAGGRDYCSEAHRDAGPSR